MSQHLPDKSQILYDEADLSQQLPAVNKLWYEMKVLKTVSSIILNPSLVCCHLGRNQPKPCPRSCFAKFDYILLGGNSYICTLMNSFQNSYP